LENAGASIRAQLQSVMNEREERGQDQRLAHAVQLIKRYQHERFAQTYADLMMQPRYAPAARFFLDDLYGPADYSERDRQFMRIVPAMVRLFPGEIVATVNRLGALHALSERLDTAMARALGSEPIDLSAYTRAWCTTAPEDREQQIDLMLQVGADLDRYTRRPMLRHSLRLMRGPAAAAGLGELQLFLERGFDTFKNMQGAEEFLHIISCRERELAASLFACGGSDRRAES
jgi:hypothetical protein